MTSVRLQKRHYIIIGILLFLIGLAGMFYLWTLVQFADRVGYTHPVLSKDPERIAPSGDVIVSPADGTVLYVKRVKNGVIPEITKRNVPIPLAQHTKLNAHDFTDGYLIGIYMHTLGVHVNRIPNNGTVVDRYVFNGPHMDMTAAEAKIGLTQAIPWLVSLKKLFGVPPYDIEDESEYILKSARETIVLRDTRGTKIYIIRIADYYVGNIVTWVSPQQNVSRGDRMGMITWGSQTDILIPDSAELKITAKVGEYVLAGETIVATY
ncbi:MAG: phosphatidylserine decarboxylase [Kiritimatiellia bacterium]|jgi:phosphatidylserine decarboxylase